MNNQIKGLVYFFISHTKHSFIIFWSILLGITIVTLTAAYLLNDTDGVMMLTLTGPMYVYCGIYGFIIVKQWIPFFIKLGATRKNILLGLGLFFLGVSTVFATVATILQSTITLFVNKLKMDIFSFMHLSLLYEDTWYIRLFIDTSIMLLSFTLLFIIGLLFYKYGLAVGGGVMGFLFLTVIFSAYKRWLSMLIDYITDIQLHLYWQISLVAIVLYVVSWLFMRKITIVNAR